MCSDDKYLLKTPLNAAKKDNIWNMTIRITSTQVFDIAIRNIRHYIIIKFIPFSVRTPRPPYIMPCVAATTDVCDNTYWFMIATS